MSEFDDKVISFLQDVTGAMGLTLDVATEETPDHLRLNLTGEGADVFLRRKGEPLDALQVIVNTAFRREDRGERHYVVDVQGFRKEQDEELRKEARALAEKVQASGEDQEWARSIRTRDTSCILPSRKTRRSQPRALAKTC